MQSIVERQAVIVWPAALQPSLAVMQLQIQRIVGGQAVIMWPAALQPSLAVI